MVKVKDQVTIAVFVRCVTFSTMALVAKVGKAFCVIERVSA
jgi:hypothetical protein